MDQPYNPFEHRDVKLPTNNCETLIHLLKGAIGSGILAMPHAMSNAGFVLGSIATMAISAIMSHSISIIVSTSHDMCRRMKVPMLGYSQTAEAAFQYGPQRTQPLAKTARILVDIFICIDLLGCCSIYLIVVATTIKQVVEIHCDTILDIRVYILVLVLPLSVLQIIRTLKRLAPLSLCAITFIFCGLGFILYYIFKDFDKYFDDERDLVAPIEKIPLFLGTTIFALECVAVAMPLANNMKDPECFIGKYCILYIGVVIIGTIYTLFGAFGYMTYGKSIEPNVTLNLPKNETLSQVVKILVAIGVLFTYSLQFYVPMEIVWTNWQSRFGEGGLTTEYALKYSIVAGTFLLAIAIPNLGPFMSLLGCGCLSFLGFIFPAAMQLAAYWEDPGLGKYNYLLIKNVLIIGFGLMSFVIGTATSISEIIVNYS